MGPAFTLRISGINVATRFSTPGVLAVVAGGLASTVTRDRSSMLVTGGLIFVAVVAAILVHEWLRIAVYRRIGVAVRGIELLLPAGNPSLIDRTSSPARELTAGLFALAPLAAIAAICASFDRATRGHDQHDSIHLIAMALIAFAVLQAMPALPLDGGRLLRALCWVLSGDPVAASGAVAAYGTIVTLGLVAGGAYLLTEPGDLPYWGFGAIVAGLHLTGASMRSLRDARWQRNGAGVAIADANLPLPGRIPANATIEEVVETLIDEGDRALLLVTGEHNHPVGIIQLADLKRSPRSAWSTQTAAEVMTPLDRILRLSAGETALDAVAILDEQRAGIAFAVMENGAVILIRRDDMLRVALPDSISAH